MSCKFELPFTDAAEVAVQKARSVIESQNGIFKGDTLEGEFEVTVFGNFVKGKYTIDGQILNLEVTDKPFFVPCNLIESFLKKEIS